MTAHCLSRLRNARGLQRRALSLISQDARKVFTSGYGADASNDEGSHLEPKLEKPVLSPGNNLDDVMEDAEQIDRSEESQFEAHIKVGAPYVRYLAGRSGRTRRSIEKETSTHIFLPAARQLKSSVSLVVKGSSQKSVEAGLDKLRDVIRKAERNSNFQYTHFVSLPLASHTSLLEQMRSFQECILAEEQKATDYVSWFPETTEKESTSVTSINSINKGTKIKSTSHILDRDLEVFFSDDESSDDENENLASRSNKINRFLFAKPTTAHITVLMLKLFTEERVDSAAEVLQGVKSKVLDILDGHEPRVFLKGIECLRGSPSEARVLSMRVQEADNGIHLQQACQAIKDAYAEAGLLAEADKKEALKLHTTLMSTSYGRRLNKTFDARRILSKYRLQNWGEYSINEVHLSQRFFYDESGYYRCCGSLQLPSAVLRKHSGI